ncbi:MAG: SRPBCC family protein [Actinomycetes bacterium]
MSPKAIELSLELNASLGQAWEELADIASHVEWMADALSIEFTSEQHRGLGTSFSCRTRVGPFTTTDNMVVLAWEEHHVISVEHRGLFTGKGTFTLKANGENVSHLSWEEQVNFPWWALGSFGALVARPVFKIIWRGNLRRLKQRIENPHG